MVMTGLLICGCMAETNVSVIPKRTDGTYASELTISALIRNRDRLLDDTHQTMTLSGPRGVYHSNPGRRGTGFK